VEVRLPSPATAGATGVLAIIEIGRATHGAIRRGAPDAVVRVNGVQLGAAPTPLIHGDKIEVGGSELFYGDDRSGGNTQFIPSSNLPDYGRLRAAVPLRGTATTGGRVISLVDGREYPVDQNGLVFGRDAGCDVVVPSTEVSRRHAEIVAGDAGYVVTDTSTNGVFVNGVRVEGIQILGRGDILRIGTEEFRFYADVLPAATPAAAAAAAGFEARPLAPAAPTAAKSPAEAVVAQAVSTPAATPPQAPRAAVAVPAVASEPPAEPAPGIPRPATRGAVATLDVVGSGVLRGQHYTIATVLAHVGRGEHNDVVVPEESVSDSHAKLQRRDGVWYVTDLGSTNGTYVAGRRIESEERLGQPADLRLGGVKLTFNAIGTEPITGPRDATRDFVGAMAADAARRAGLAAVAEAADGSEPRTPAGRSRGAPRDSSSGPSRGAAKETGASSWLWWLLAIVVVAAIIYFIKAR
jgi:pSer/pThr/pTyr-binding forkhead associated (FHA) protein